MGERSLKDEFQRLYNLERNKEVVVKDKGKWVENSWVWVWDWIRAPRGRTCGELDDLTNVLNQIVLVPEGSDRWQWIADGEQVYTVSSVARRIDGVILDSGQSGLQTKRNKYVPNKVNIFAWRLRRKRLSVRVELDKRGIDLNSVLCPWCEESGETIGHCILLCSEVSGVWNKVFEWWSLEGCSWVNIGDMFELDVMESNSKVVKEIWEGVVWVTAYVIWKNRNAKVFGKKVLRDIDIFHEVQIKSFEWVKTRLKWKKVDWNSWINDPKAEGMRTGQ